MSEAYDGLANRLENFFNPMISEFQNSELKALNIYQYRIERVLGSGGFGIVYLAQDTELNRLVALKLPRMDALFDQQKRMRFSAEAKTAARLNHPGIVKVYQADLEGAMPFIASEFCDGPNLAQWLGQSDRLPPWQQCVELLADVADAVQHAHQHGVFHRDIKPGNIIITLNNASTEASTEFANWELEQCRARLTDFGLAKLVGSPMSETRTSQIVGTPLYMAPEQTEQGDGARPTTAVDIYSLGVVLFELLTGQMPINGSSYIHALDNIRTMPPDRLSAYRDQLPGDIEITWRTSAWQACGASFPNSLLGNPFSESCHGGMVRHRMGNVNRNLDGLSRDGSSNLQFRDARRIRAGAGGPFSLDID